MKKNKVSLKEKLLLKVRKNPKKAVRVFLAFLFSLGVFFGFVLGSFVSCSRSRKNAVTASADVGYGLGTESRPYYVYDGVPYALIGQLIVSATFGSSATECYAASFLSSVAPDSGFGEYYMLLFQSVNGNSQPYRYIYHLPMDQHISKGEFDTNVFTFLEVSADHPVEQNMKPVTSSELLAINASSEISYHGLGFYLDVVSKFHRVKFSIERRERGNYSEYYRFFWQNPAFCSQSYSTTRSTDSAAPSSRNEEELPTFSVYKSAAIYTETQYQEGVNNALSQGRVLGYQNGYNAGLNASGENNFKSLFTAVLDAPVEVLTSLLDVEILGFNFQNVFLGLLSVALVFAIYRLFSSFGGKP